jgi:predicted TPR repeat methyltransferase
MDTKEAYDLWATRYDTNDNKTRDLEAQALRITLASIPFDNCLEIGCGTGKNTEWLIQKAKAVLAVDLSEEMLRKAKEKISSERVQFRQADITRDWIFTNRLYDLVSFSLVLEHIDNLEPIFEKVSKSLVQGGHVYLSELHPFKQYAGSKARFDTDEGQQVVNCFNHNVSDFIQAAKQHGLVLADLNEYFDNNDRTTIPRILTIVFRKS